MFPFPVRAQFIIDRYVDIAVRIATASRHQKAFARKKLRHMAAKIYHTHETVSAWAELLLRIATPR